MFPKHESIHSYKKLFQSLTQADPQIANQRPPIIKEGGNKTKAGLPEKEYTEYFMPVNEHKKSFRLANSLFSISIKPVF